MTIEIIHDSPKTIKIIDKSYNNNHKIITVGELILILIKMDYRKQVDIEIWQEGLNYMWFNGIETDDEGVHLGFEWHGE